MEFNGLTNKIRDESIIAAVAAAYGAYGAILLAGRGSVSDDGIFTKDDPNVGHHAIVTAGDVASEEHILRTIYERFPYTRFITEEGTSKEFANAIISDKDVKNVLAMPIVFGVDPIDGTSQFERGLYEWSISVGVMKNGVHVGGAIYAPMINGGRLFVGRRESGTFVLENGKSTSEKCVVKDRSADERIIVFGPDIFFMPEYCRFVYGVSGMIRTSNGTGSCPLGLALVASGQIDGLVQPVQCPWDWFAGWPLVEEAGGKVIFYHYRDGKPVRMEKPDISSYSPSERKTAFIAGTPKCAEWLWEMLVEKWDAKFL